MHPQSSINHPQLQHSLSPRISHFLSQEHTLTSVSLPFNDTPLSSLSLKKTHRASQGLSSPLARRFLLSSSALTKHQASSIKHQDQGFAFIQKSSKTMKSQKKKNSQEKSHSEVGVRIRHSCAIDKLRAVNVKLTEDQRKMIEKTPFRVLLDIPSIKINGYLLSSLIERWDEDVNGFWFKGTLVRFTPHDVACILGLRVGGKVVGVFYDHGSSQVHDLLQASFPNPNKSLDRTHVQNLFPNCASPVDFVRVYIAFAFTSFLFPLPSKGIHGNFFRLLDNLNQVGDYGWGKAVYDFLVDGIRHAVKARKEKKNSSEIYIQGCVPLLQLWALEHTGMVQASTSMSLWPRIRKWTSKNLTNKDACATIHIIEDSKEVVAELVPTEQEFNESVVMESLNMVMELPHYKRKYEEMEKSSSQPDVDLECDGDKRDAFTNALSYMSPEDPSVAFLGETSQKRHSESNEAKYIKIQPRTCVSGRQVCSPFQAISLKGCSSAVLRPLDEPNAEIEILGTGMSAKMWEVTVDHARTCVLDKRVYLYCPPGSPQKTGVAFNVVGQVMGLRSGCQYVPIDKLSETEKADAHNLVISAFEHWGEVVSFEDETSLMGGSLHLTDLLYPSNSPGMESSNGSKFLPSHEIGEFDFSEAFCDNDDQQFFNTDCFIQSPDRSAAVAIAQRRFVKILTVLKWLTIRRIVALKKTHVREFRDTVNGTCKEWFD